MWTITVLSSSYATLNYERKVDDNKAIIFMYLFHVPYNFGVMHDENKLKKMSKMKISTFAFANFEKAFQNLESGLSNRMAKGRS